MFLPVNVLLKINVNLVVVYWAYVKISCLLFIPGIWNVRLLDVLFFPLKLSFFLFMCFKKKKLSIYRSIYQDLDVCCCFVCILKNAYLQLFQMKNDHQYFHWSLLIEINKHLIYVKCVKDNNVIHISIVCCVLLTHHCLVLVELC